MTNAAPHHQPPLQHLHQIAVKLCTLGALTCALLLSACTTTPKTTATTATENTTPANTTTYSGRLALSIEQQPPQNFSSNFQLTGSPNQGSLHILSPFGSTLAIAQWSHNTATLQQGRNIHQFNSLDELLTQLAGAQIPITALFDWLEGKNTAAEGWQTDLTQHKQGKISAWRTHPQPTAKLQIILQ